MSRIGGERLRLRISNVFGAAPLELSSATVALRDEGATVVPATLSTVTFSGAPSISIPPGTFVYSDPVPLRTEATSELAVSLFFANAIPTVTRHGAGARVTYLSEPGDFTGAVTIPATRETTDALFLTGVEVEVAGGGKLIVCFGDSITVGGGVSGDGNWPAILAQRLAGEAAVINQGITGSRLLHDFVGDSALRRFERDALSWDNVEHVIVLIGTNDLGYSQFDARVLPAGVHAPQVGADEMIEGYRQLIAMAYARGIEIIGATLPPFEGAGHFSVAGEAARVAINEWIREGGEFDGVVDFDTAVRDASQPQRFAAGFHDDDDWLHPNYAGYRAMADSIDLSLFDR